MLLMYPGLKKVVRIHLQSFALQRPRYQSETAGAAPPFALCRLTIVLKVLRRWRRGEKRPCAVPRRADRGRERQDDGR